MEKPKEIIAIEKFYGITLKELTESESVDAFINRNSFSLDQNQNIVGLNLRKNNISNIQPLSQLTSLKKLILSENIISDLSPLMNMNQLKDLNLYANGISDLSPLKGLSSLTNLNLYNNQVLKLIELSKIISLVTLNLNNNRISDISTLENLINLKDIDLGFNQIHDLSPLTNLNNLEKIILNFNKIRDLNQLSFITNRKGLILFVEGNPFMENFKKFNVKTNHYNLIVTELSKLKEKPKEIIEIEKFYRITLTENKSKYTKTKNEYKLNNKGQVIYLNLSHNNISDLSPIKELSSLTELDLSNNLISDLSPIRKLISLKKLYLSDNQISDLSQFEFILTLTELFCINVLRNPLFKEYGFNFKNKLNAYHDIVNELKKYKEKPKEILEIEKFYGITLTESKNINNILENQFLLDSDKQIIGLNLSKNQISQFTILKSLTSLSYLSLSKNQITNLSSLKELTSLKYLYLNNNEIEDLSPIEDLTSLTHLDLSRNQIKDISPLKRLTSLTYLSLVKNQFTDLTFLKTLKSLSHLYLDNNQIYDPKPLKNLTSLIYLKLSNNVITDLSFLKVLTSINYLYLDNNQIDNLSSVKHLTSLIYLNLSDNLITDLYPLKELISLEELILNNNQILDISPIKNLTSLFYLNLSDNKISELYQFEFIIALKNKLTIKATNNPFCSEFNENLEYGKNHYDTILNELLKQKELKQNQTSNYILPAKVLLLGNTQSGKSTMMDYLLQENEPRTIRKIEESTHILSIETLPKQLKKEELPKAIFYDFGGQDYYHGLYRAFLNNGALSIIFWNSENDQNQIREDDRNHKSLTRDFNRDYWLNQLKYSEYQENKTKKNSNEVLKANTILMVQTHADLGHKRATYNGNCEDMHIENEFFVALSQKAIDSNATQKMSLDYFEASLLEQINLKQETVKETLWYKELIEYIQSRKGNQTTTLKTISKYYNREADPDKKLLPEVLRVLALSGMILYYKDDNDLKDVAWLDPTATIKDIHETILSKRQLGGTKGIIKKETFDKNDERVIKLLRNQKVVFLDPNPEDNNYIIPGYLPLTSEDSKMYDLLVFDLVEPNFVIKFNFFIPFGLINQLICHYGNNPEKKHYWRDQLIFTKDHCKVLIQLDFSNLEIAVSIKSKETKKSVNEIERELFVDILDLYYDRKYDIVDSLINTETHQEMIITYGENYRKGIEQEIKELKKYYKSPDDMYISVDNKTFVHHQTLENKELTSTKITAYGFDERVEIQNNKEITIRTINEFKTREQSSGLYKNFTKNENIKSVKKIFISYSRKDVDYKDELKKHLNMLSIFEIADNWSCEEITIGKWDAQIQKELQEADLIIYMLSANFFNSKYILDKEVKVGMENIDNDKSKDILCVVVSEFVGLDKLKNLAENREKTATQEALLRLSEQQYLPYDYVENTTTGNREEKIISLKEHSNRNTLESALASITNKIADFCSK